MTEVRHTTPALEARQAMRRDPFLRNIMTRTPAEIEAHIDANVNTAAEVKELLKRVTMLISVVAQDLYK